MSCSPTSPLERLAGALAQGLRRELWLTPKPGLVDRESGGSHHDLTFGTMERSIAIVHGAFEALAASLRDGEPLARQVALGEEAERRMLGALGTNTHKGALFLGGLLLVGCHRAAPAPLPNPPSSGVREGRGGAEESSALEPSEAALREAVSAVARELHDGRAALSTHGAEARRRFRVGGILHEALAGLPSLFEGALPAFRAARQRGGDLSVASFAMLARLMQTVEDTTTLHRCGEEGLARIRADGARLERILERAGDHVGFLRERDAAYKEMNLTMGGVADLLGMAFGYLAYRSGRHQA